MAQNKAGRYGKYGELKRFERLNSSKRTKDGSARAKTNIKLKIAPGHPNTGRR